jgi:hypothetical protein
MSLARLWDEVGPQGRLLKAYTSLAPFWQSTLFSPGGSGPVCRGNALLKPENVTVIQQESI